MNKILFTYKSIGVIYISSLLGYNIVNTYSDSKKSLLQYRKEKNSKGILYLDDQTGCDAGRYMDSIEPITSEWEAVKRGAQEKMWERFTHSIIWPITITNNFIPWIVLQFNPETITNHIDSACGDGGLERAAMLNKKKLSKDFVQKNE
jgi:hypothetical protein